LQKLGAAQCESEAMMNQVLHIFRKDVRHLWIEITVSLLADAAYVWKILYEWGHPQQRMIDMPEFFSGLLAALVPVAWCLLVVRSVQDESLVGDRQFWLTRPYTWKKLLAAKALFAVTFISLPLFVCNVIFLEKAGFSPLANLPGLLLIQLMMFILVVLSTATLCVVTPTLVQLLLWVLGIAVYTGCMASLSNMLPSSAISTGPNLFDNFSIPGFGVACLAIIVWQFSQRRAWIARVAIVGISVVVTVFSLIPQSASEVLHAYPPMSAGEQLPFRLAPVTPDTKLPVDPSAIQAKTVDIALPYHVSGVAPGSFVTLAGAHIAIRAKNGANWTSSWANDYGELWPVETETYVAASVDRRFFDQSRFVPADITVTLAYTEYHESHTRQIVAEPGIFPVQGVGLCWTSGSEMVWWSQQYLECRSPINSPMVSAQYDTANSTCGIGPGKTPAPPMTRYAALLNESVLPASPPLTAVVFYGIRFSGPERPSDEKIQIRGICPGTPVTISTPIVTRMRRTEIKLDGVALSDYVRRANPLIGR
jgi:hypothetical protein